MSEILHGIWNSHPICKHYQAEKVVRQGRSGWMAIFQTTSIKSALDLIGEIAIITGLSKGPSRLGYMVALAVPAVIYNLKGRVREEKHGWKNRVLTGLQENLLTACQGVSILHAMVMIASGKAWRGGTALGVLAFHNWQGYFPHPIRRKGQEALFIATQAAGLLLGSRKQQLWALFGCAFNIPPDWIPVATSSKRPPHTACSLTDFQHSYSRKKFAIEPWHMVAYKDQALPQTPCNLDLNGYRDLLTKIPWQNDRVSETLKKKLSEDPRWTELPKKGTEQEHITAGIKRLITGLGTKTIEVGELKDFDPCITEARLLLAKLQSLAPKDYAPTLIDLGIGAHYCATGVHREVHLAYITHCQEAPTDLFSQINQVFALSRLQIFDTWLKKEFGGPFLLRVTDDHTHNLYASYLQKDYGLPDQMLTEADPFAADKAEQWILGALWDKKFSRFFFQKYRPTSLLKDFRTTLKNQAPQKNDKANYQITPSLIIKWFKEKIEGTEVTLEDIYDEDGHLKEWSILYMLVELGFLKVSVQGGA